MGMNPANSGHSRGNPMKQYLLSMYAPEGGTPDPDTLAKVMIEVHAIRQQLQNAGQWVFAGGLHEARTATVVRFDRGEALITDGPYAEAKEHIGGIIVIRAPDLDGALEWARKYAKVITLPIEVRPFQDQDGQ
jgi:hypothetical protein